MKGRGWGLCCPHFESQWLRYSLYIVQSKLSGGVFRYQGAQQSGLCSINSMATKEPMPTCFPKVGSRWRCCRLLSSSRATVSTLQDYQFLLKGSHSAFLASYGPFSQKGRSDRHCV